MSLNRYSMLAQANIQRVVNQLVDIREFPEQLGILTRVPVINAEQDEVLLRFRGRVFAASILSDTGRAPARPGPEMTLSQSTLPRLGHKIPLTAKQYELLARIEENVAGSRDADRLRIGISQQLADLVEGIRVRWATMAYGMQLGSFAYTTHGKVKATIAWDNFPSALQLDVSGVSTTRWSAASTATPVADIQSLIKTGKTVYGVIYDQIEMSQTAFDNMIRTTEFKGLVQSLFAVGQVTGSGIALPFNNTELMKPMAQQILGVKNIIINDWTYNELGEDGQTISLNRYMPVNKVILSSMSHNGNDGVHDIANTEVLESMAGMVPGMVGEATGGPFGPYGYVAAASLTGDPPGLELHARAVSLPRRHFDAASAVITVDL